MLSSLRVSFPNKVMNAHETPHPVVTLLFGLVSVRSLRVPPILHIKVRPVHSFTPFILSLFLFSIMTCGGERREQATGRLLRTAERTEEGW